MSYDKEVDPYEAWGVYGPEWVKIKQIENDEEFLSAAHRFRYYRPAPNWPTPDELAMFDYQQELNVRVLISNIRTSKAINSLISK